MAQAIHRSFKVVFCFAERASTTPRRSVHQFIARDEADAVAKMRLLFQQSRRGEPYYWINAFDETTGRIPKSIQVPEDIRQVRSPNHDEQPPLHAA